MDKVSHNKQGILVFKKKKEKDEENLERNVPQSCEVLKWFLVQQR